MGGSSDRSRQRAGSGPTDRTGWWLVFGLLVLVGTVWALATPPLTGPDEIEQGRRAAAVVRGELIGDRQPDVPPLVVDVTVPATYGDVSVDHWRCFLGPLVDGSPQEAMSLPPSTCPEIPSDQDPVVVQTVQYRGQPFFYAWTGLGTLWPGVTGTYLMRLLSVLPCAALLASAATSVRTAAAVARRARRTHELEVFADREQSALTSGSGGGAPGESGGLGPAGIQRATSLAGLGLAAAVTPMVLYLAASTNPSGLEIAAALSAWATGMVLAGGAGRPTGRVVARFGVALVVLSLARGLGPLFAATILGGTAVVAGWRRTWTLARVRALWAWGAAILMAVGLSAAWLAHIQADYALPDRPGTGFTTALGYLPWYLRQSIGVFGTNDGAISPLAAAGWIAVLGGATAAGLWRAGARSRLVALIALAVGLAISVTAEGLSLPPIGFFWQGRYALPILLGAVVVATTGPPARRRSGDPATDALDRRHRGAAPTRHPGAAVTADGLVAGAGLVLVGLQVTAYLTVARRYASRGPGSLALGEALLDPRWQPPVPSLLLLALFAVGVAAVTVVLLRVEPVPGPPVPGQGLPLDAP